MARFSALALGTEVLGADGRLVGRIKEVFATSLLIDRAGRRDVYVPFDAIQTLWHNQIVLVMPARRVDDMRWPHPPLLSL